MNPQKKRSPLVISFTIFAAAAFVCALIAFGLTGSLGLQGAALGVGIATLMCGTSHALMAWARRAQGNAILTAMLAGALASLVILVGSILALGALARDRVVPAALTALCIYLAYRFGEGALEHRAALRSKALREGRVA